MRQQLPQGLHPVAPAARPLPPQPGPLPVPPASCAHDSPTWPGAKGEMPLALTKLTHAMVKHTPYVTLLMTP